MRLWKIVSSLNCTAKLGNAGDENPAARRGADEGGARLLMPQLWRRLEVDAKVAEVGVEAAASVKLAASWFQLARRSLISFWWISSKLGIWMLSVRAWLERRFDARFPFDSDADESVCGF